MKLSDKLGKVNEDFTVTKYDNGYKVSVGGEDHSENWADANILCDELAEVVELVDEWSSMEMR